MEQYAIAFKNLDENRPLAEHYLKEAATTRNADQKILDFKPPLGPRDTNITGCRKYLLYFTVKGVQAQETI